MKQETRICCCCFCRFCCCVTNAEFGGHKCESPSRVLEKKRTCFMQNWLVARYFLHAANVDDEISKLTITNFTLRNTNKHVRCERKLVASSAGILAFKELSHHLAQQVTISSQIVANNSKQHTMFICSQLAISLCNNNNNSSQLMGFALALLLGQVTNCYSVLIFGTNLSQ